MRKQLAAAVAFFVAVAGCNVQSSLPEIHDPPPRPIFEGAHVELLEQGGIAAFSTTSVVRHDDRYFSYTRGRICPPLTACTAPLESATGALTAAAADSLFGIVLAQSPLGLRDDYGITQGGADMVSYTLTMTIGALTKSIRADDGTMPQPVRRIVDAVHGTIAAARK